MKSLATLITLAALCACGCGKQDDDKQAPAPAPGPADLDKPEVAADALPDSAKMEAYMQATIAATEGAAGDCTKLVTPVVELAQQNAELLARMVASGRTDQAKQWKSDHSELYAGFRKAMGAIATCAKHDPKLVEVLKSLSPAKPPAPPTTRTE